MESNIKYKIIITFSLLLFLIVLLFLYFRQSDNTDSEKSGSTFTTPPKQLTADEMKIQLSGDIDSVLYMFGIKKEWIKERNESLIEDKKDKKKTEPDVSLSRGNLWFSKEVLVPRDLPVAEVNLELAKHLAEIEFGCLGNENPKTGTVSIEFFHLRDSSKKTLADIIFTATDKVRRDAADVCIILDDAADYSINELERILGINENFSVILPDQIDRIDAQTVVMDSKRDYLLKVRIGTEDDITSEFKSNMSDKDLKIKVRTICYEYDKAAGAIILNPKKLYKIESDVLYEFSRYNLKAFRDTSFIKFASVETGAKKVDALLKDIISRSLKGNKSIIYIASLTPEEFDIFNSGSYKIKRIGYRFYTFTEIMKRRSKTDNLSSKEIQN